MAAPPIGAEPAAHPSAFALQGLPPTRSALQRTQTRSVAHAASEGGSADTSSRFIHSGRPWVTQMEGPNRECLRSGGLQARRCQSHGRLVRTRMGAASLAPSRRRRSSSACLPAGEFRAAAAQRPGSASRATSQRRLRASDRAGIESEKGNLVAEGGFEPPTHGL